jgi:histidine triad (HIT) family protein
MPDCLFCRIAAREIPASVVCETPTTLAFRDVHPQAPTHVLVIPKEHVSSMAALGEGQASLIVDLTRTIQDVAKRENLNEKGFRVVVNNGKDANQTVAHLHYHVLAGRKLSWPPG